ncbi:MULTISPECIES: lysylphosphatidylglycerol synthase domain-containing protein [Mumia]|uniref:lysylphosphatidylglycerol synthase domain-containing protein n=1 Tax=Mumia TaxID=1546255 RepID=UPI001FBB5206|nr:lysylphosphatidylglycerol synthase domain-containing protein [Mumia sp. ZJ430]
MRRAALILKPLVPAAVLVVVVAHVGTVPFLDGFRATTQSSAALAGVFAALVLTALSTVCAARRWQVVSRELGASIRLKDAVVAYYRSQILNVTLPLGVAGDVHRGLVHGRDTDDTARGLRTVAWERFAGQAVCVVVAAGVLVAVPSPLRSALGAVLAVGAAAVCAVLVVVAALPGSWRGVLAGDVRRVLHRPSPTVQLVGLSVLAFCGHVAVFLVAVRIAAPQVAATDALPAALLVLLAASVPMSLAGWGPREGVAAWAFAAGGLGASQGVEVSVVYGLLALVATAPGIAVLLSDARGRIRPGPSPMTGAVR